MSEQKPYEPPTYTLEEFVAQAKKDLDDYQKDWTPPNATNDFHTGKHSWSEWFKAFHGYFNWEER